jgi:hypothetical protein
VRITLTCPVDAALEKAPAEAVGGGAAIMFRNAFLAALPFPLGTALLAFAFAFLPGLCCCRTKEACDDDTQQRAT